MSSRSSFTTIVSASENWMSRSGIDGAGEHGLLSSSSQMKHLLQMMSAGSVVSMKDGPPLVVAVVGERRRRRGKGTMAKETDLICYPWSMVFDVGHDHGHGQSWPNKTPLHLD